MAAERASLGLPGAEEAAVVPRAGSVAIGGAPHEDDADAGSGVGVVGR